MSAAQTGPATPLTAAMLAALAAMPPRINLLPPGPRLAFPATVAARHLNPPVPGEAPRIERRPVARYETPVHWIDETSDGEDRRDG